MKQRLGHGYQFVEELPLEELQQFKDHRRLTVFYNKGTKCANPECDRVGTRLVCGKDAGGRLHWDVYTEDLVLMTVDHIHPKSKGGSEDLSNKNPMCTHCNSKKGNVLDAGMIEDPTLRAIYEMKSQSNKTHQLLKNLMNTRKFKGATANNTVYCEKVLAATKEATKQHKAFQSLLDSFIKLAVDKGLFTTDELI